MDEVTNAINHFSVLMEDQNAKLDAVLEMVGAQPTLADFHRLEGKVDDLSQRMGIAEVAVKDVSRDLAEHKNMSAHSAHGYA